MDLSFQNFNSKCQNILLTIVIHEDITNIFPRDKHFHVIEKFN